MGRSIATHSMTSKSTRKPAGGTSPTTTKPEQVVLIFGAGATKACGGPLTNEILPQAFQPQIRAAIAREGYDDLLEHFLIENFHLPPNQRSRKGLHYPGLPLLLSLIDTAIDRKQPLGANWGADRLVLVREALEYVIFALLDHNLKAIKRNFYYDLLEKVFETREPIAISLNYDIILDNAITQLVERRTPAFPFYGCDIRTQTYLKSKYCGKLLKLHGSLNWLYCPNCSRLDLGISKSGRGTVKVLHQLYAHNKLEERYGCHGSPCNDCRTFVRPVLITPTHRKDYRNPHVAQVWYQAEQELRRCTSAVIVGYSLPEDDVDVAYLFKRGLGHLPANKITVVEFDPSGRSVRDHPVGGRYRSLFGDGIVWRTDGFQAYVESL